MEEIHEKDKKIEDNSKKAEESKKRLNELFEDIGNLEDKDIIENYFKFKYENEKLKNDKKIVNLNKYSEIKELNIQLNSDLEQKKNVITKNSK